MTFLSGRMTGFAEPVYSIPTSRVTRLALLALLLPLLLGSGIYWGYQQGNYSPAVAIVLSVLVYTGLLLGVLWYSFRKLRSGERLHQQQEQLLEQLMRSSIAELSTSQDELKDSFTALEASERRLRSILDSMFIFVGLFSTDGRFLYANGTPLQVAGITPEDVHGKPLWETPWWLHSEEERQKLKECLQKTGRGETVRYDGSIVDKQGNILLLDLIFGPVRNEKGEVIQIIGSAVDVTARKEAERKLQQSHERYQALVDNFPNGAVFLVDQDHRFLVVGGSELSEVGYTKEMLVGRTIAETMPAEVVASMLPATRQTLAGESLVYPEESGDRKYVVRTTPVRDERGQVVAAMLMTQNVTREKLAEEGLKFYQFLVDHTEDPIYWISPEDNFRFSYVNQATCRHYGMSAEQLLAMSVPDWDPTFTWEDCHRLSERIREKKQLVFETRHRHAGGEEIPVEVSATLLYYKGKEYYGGYIKDLRERKKAEAALRESEERYRHLFESNKDPLLLVDVETRQMVDVNPAACQIYGYSREEMKRLKNTDIVAESEQPIDLMLHREASVLLRYHRKKDGTIFPAELAFGYLKVNDRQTAIVAVRDITERMEFTRQLEEEKQRLELALWGGDLGLWDWNIQQETVVFNEKYAQMLDYTLDQLTPEINTWARLLHPDDQEAVRQKLQLHLSGQTPYHQAEQRLMSGNGTWKWILATGKVISRDAEGKPLRMIGTHMDITRRKQAELEIRKLATVAQKTENAVTITDAAGRIEWVNDAFVRTSGYTLAEAAGRKPGELLQGPETDPASVQRMREAISRRESVELEILNYTQTGVAYWQYLSIQPVFDENGSLSQFISIATDITERKKVEAQLHFQSTILENVRDSVIVTDLEGRISYFNQGAESIFGYDAAEMMGSTPQVLYPDQNPAELVAHLQQILEGNEYADEWQGRRKDGTRVWVDAKTSLLRDSKGQMLGFLGVSKDITDRKHAQQQLTESEASLRSIFDASIQAYFLLDATYRVLKFNRTAEEYVRTIFNRTIQEGDDMLELSDPRALDDFRRNVAAAFRGEKVLLTREVELPRVGPIWVEVQYLPVQDTDGKVSAVAFVSLDITERKRAEQAILDLNASLEGKVEERTAQLQAVNKELEAFSYSVSHDLRAPLRSIDGFSKVLLNDYQRVLDEEGRDYLQTIRQAAQRMGHLIDDLLKLSKITRAELHRLPVDLTEIAGQILGEFRRDAGERKVLCRIAPGLVAEGDQRLLQIALQNLLSNAWKYTSRREEAMIEVGSVETPRGAAFFVRDNGAGFDMQHAEKLFGAFQRMHTNHEFEGTGIGLAIVQRIILRHGGEIWAEAEPRRGATFFFTLPVL